MDYSEDILNNIEDTKKGNDYFYKYPVSAGLKLSVANSVASKSSLIIIDNKSELIFTWIGSRQWYKSTTGKNYYSKDQVMAVAIPEIIKLIDNPGNSIKLINPKLEMKLKTIDTSSEDDDKSSDDNKEIVCVNKASASNALFNLISKYQ